jgi:hypothetical protein
MNVPTDTPSQTTPTLHDGPDSLERPTETAPWSFCLPFKAVFKPTNVSILTILGIALALRFWGLPFGLPNLTRPDEQNISQFVALHILQSFFAGQPDLNPHFFEYPSLYIYFVTLLYGVYHLIGHLLGAFLTPTTLCTTIWITLRPFTSSRAPLPP